MGCEIGVQRSFAGNRGLHLWAVCGQRCAQQAVGCGSSHMQGWTHAMLHTLLYAHALHAPGTGWLAAGPVMCTAACTAAPVRQPCGCMQCALAELMPVSATPPAL